MAVEKIYCNESQKSLRQKLSFEDSLFRFHFVFTVQYFDRYYYKYPVKQTASLYLKLPWKPRCFGVFFVIFGKISFCFF